MKNSHLVAPVFLAGDYHLPHIQSAPYAVMTNGADWFTLFRNFLPIDRCGEGDGAGDVEVVGEGVAVCLALDGVLLSVAHIVVVGIDNPRLHHGVDSREAFVGDDEAQGVRTGQGLSAVRRLFCICHRLPCRLTARGECEGGQSGGREVLIVSYYLYSSILCSEVTKKG